MQQVDDIDTAIGVVFEMHVVERGVGQRAAALGQARAVGAGRDGDVLKRHVIGRDAHVVDGVNDRRGRAGAGEGQRLADGHVLGVGSGGNNDLATGRDLVNRRLDGLFGGGGRVAVVGVVTYRAVDVADCRTGSGRRRLRQTQTQQQHRQQSDESESANARVHEIVFSPKWESESAEDNAAASHG